MLAPAPPQPGSLHSLPCYMQNPSSFLKTVAAEQEALVDQLERARQLLPEVSVSRDIRLKIR